MCSLILAVLRLNGNQVYVVRAGSSDIQHHKSRSCAGTPSLLMDFYIFGKFYNFFLKNKPINVRKNIFPSNGVGVPS